MKQLQDITIVKSEIVQAGSMIVPEEFVESDQFLNMNFGFKKCALFSLWYVLKHL
jgi:hypothetical protein